MSIKFDNNPYGFWHCRDGSIVLFNRGYKPIMRKLIDGSVVQLDPSDRPNDIVSEMYFYEDRTANAVVKHMGFIRDSMIKSAAIIAQRQAAKEDAPHG